jgi:hypothetical protein
MAITLPPKISPPRWSPTAPPDPEALIAEARRRQRRRRAAIVIAVFSFAAIGAAVVFALNGAPTRTGPSPAAPAPFSHGSELELHLRGFGKPLPTTIDRGPCPQGRGIIQIRGAAQSESALDCVLTIGKLDTPTDSIKRITQTVTMRYRLHGGSIATRETQTINFARDQRHTTAVFRGVIRSGSGRYAGVHGTVSGGGRGVDGNANWTIVLHVR